ncbi:MAG TPA: tRNA pseudouridine(55) synthase TruB [Candidatus Bathyarchaeia archaeon]|nr:tRNA pseudouridine(55) synthase TruB [Candidatus Bathyarchaeia archaeon]
MAARKERTDLNGIVVVNKPSGITSHDVVDRVRRKFRMRRIGHAGTLDPLATGVLVILVGKGTKLFDQFVGFDKGYRATLVLGTSTVSADIEGKVIETRPYEGITQEKILEVFRSFLGEGQQIPPMVSAVKSQGRRLYELARKGLTVDREPRAIRIDAIDLLRFDPPMVEFYLKCSKGTYVRKFAEDVGLQLGCGACICQIERTVVGPYQIEEAVDLDHLEEGHVRDFNGDHMPVAAG